MSDKYRILGKFDEKSNDGVLILEVQISRTMIISRDNINAIFNNLNEGNNDGGFDEIINFIKSCFLTEDFKKEDFSFIDIPLKDLHLSNENIKALVYALSTQEEEITIYNEGSLENNNIVFVANIYGRTYKKEIRNSYDAKVLAKNLTEFRNEINALGVIAVGKAIIKLIEKLEPYIDKALRWAGAYELAERAIEAAKERADAERARRELDREWREHFDRERERGIDRAREMDFADRISRTA